MAREKGLGGGGEREREICGVREKEGGREGRDSGEREERERKRRKRDKLFSLLTFISIATEAVSFTRPPVIPSVGGGCVDTEGAQYTELY